MNCDKCIKNCPLRGQHIEGGCEDFDSGEPERSPTPTECLGMVMYEPPPPGEADEL
jgi:hypothetical protein